MRSGRRWASDEEEGDDAHKRVCFVLEDSADLVIQESRAAHYDKMNRLLNITDGLFGQGREDLFILTFNERVDRIDPAFLRPGRCLAKVEFPKFSAPEAALWLAQRGAPWGGIAPPPEMTLLISRVTLPAVVKSSLPP